MKENNVLQDHLVAKAVKHALHQNANSNIGINANNCRDVLEASLIKKAAKAVITAIDKQNKGSRAKFDIAVACKEVFDNHDAYNIDRTVIDALSDMFKRIDPKSVNTPKSMAEFFQQYFTAVEAGGQFYIDAAKHNYDFDMYMIKVVKTVLSEKFSSNLADDRFAKTKMPVQFKGIGHNYKHFDYKFGDVKVESDEVFVFGPQSEIKRAKIKQHIISAAEHYEKSKQASMKKFEEEAIETVIALASQTIEAGSNLTPDAVVKKDLSVMKSLANFRVTTYETSKAEEEANFNAYKNTQVDEFGEEVIQKDDDIKKAFSFGPEIDQGLSSMARKASNLGDKPIQYIGLLALFSDNGYYKKNSILNFDSEFPAQAMANILPDEYMSGAAHLIKNSSEFYTINIIAGRKGITKEELPETIVTDGSDKIIDVDGDVFKDARLSGNTPVGITLHLIEKENGRLAYAVGYHQIKEMRAKRVSSDVVINLYLAGNGKRVYKDDKLIGFEFNENAQENIDKINAAIADKAQFVVVATKKEMFLVAKREDGYEFIADIDPGGKYKEKDYDKKVAFVSSKLKAYLNGMVIVDVRTSVAVSEKGEAKMVLFGTELDERLEHKFNKADIIANVAEEVVEEIEEEEEDDMSFNSVNDYSMFLGNVTTEAAEEIVEEEDTDGDDVTIPADDDIEDDDIEEDDIEDDDIEEEDVEEVYEEEL